MKRGEDQKGFEKKPKKPRVEPKQQVAKMAELCKKEKLRKEREAQGPERLRGR